MNTAITACKTGRLSPSLGRECTGPVLYDGYLGGHFCHTHDRTADEERQVKVLARIPTWNQDADEELS